VALSVGIGIVTYDRKATLSDRAQAVTRQPAMAFVVSDDRSSDGTLPMLRDKQVPVITGVNIGIAWNKNRALFLLSHMLGSVIAILLKDDTEPNRLENRIEKTAVIENNFIQHSISRQEYKASVGKTTVFLTGNRQRVGDRLQNYPNLVPTTGLWNAGQRVSFDQQESDGAIGAICTQTGVPGQWRKLKRDLP
jgi:glycosyltransferase involved in cell wall biosynthesis